MTAAERTLKWWNEYKEKNGCHPLPVEVECQLQMAIEEENSAKEEHTIPAFDNPEFKESYEEIKNLKIR